MKSYNKVLFYLLFVLGSCSNSPNDVKTDKKGLELVWEYQYQDETKSLSEVSNASTIINNNTILTSLDASITAINTANGALIWRYKLIPTTKLYSDQLLYDEKNVYVKQERSNQAVTLNLLNGNPTWQVELDSGNFRDQASDIQSKTDIYWSGDKQDVYIYNKNGEFIRRIQFKYSVRSGHYFDEDLVIAHAYRDTDLSPFAFGQIIRYDLRADTVKWKYETNLGGYYNNPILLENEIIYAGTTEGPSEFVAINATTGEVLWRRADLGAWAYVLSETAIYINEGADLVALDKKTGRQMWRTKFPGGGYDSSNVAYMDGYVYHSHSGSFFVLDAQTGEIVFSTVLPDRSYAGNVSAGFGKVFVQSSFHLFCYKGWETE